MECVMDKSEVLIRLVLIDVLVHEGQSSYRRLLY